MLNEILLLLFQLPGVPTRLPGVPIEYMPTKGAEAALALYDKMFTNSLWLTLAVIPIAIGFLLLQKMSIFDFVARLFLCGMLLASLPYVYGGVMMIGDAFADSIISKDDRGQLETEFHKIADTSTNNDEGSVKLGPIGAWYELLAILASVVMPGTEETIIEIFMGVMSLFFFFTNNIIALIWRAFAVLIFIFGPISVVLGILPGYGTRILSNWFGALIQIGIGWPLWMAITAWFVKYGQFLFQKEYDVTNAISFANQMEAVGIGTLFVIFNLMTPVFVNIFLPISNFSAGATSALLAGTYIISNTISKVTNTAISAGTSAGRVLVAGAEVK